jgi:hypothetical protein
MLQAALVEVCHPEATCFSSPKDLDAPRDVPAVLADTQNARWARFLT